MIKLYEHPFSPYVQKVKIALYEKNVPFEVEIPNAFSGGATDFGKTNPRLEVPALVPPPPILLPLTIQASKPTPQRDLLEETQKNRKPDHLKPPIIEVGPQRMDRTTVGATISLQQECFLKPIKKPAHITMTPQPWASALRTPRGTRPRILPSYLLQELDIDMKIQYQRSMLWGITEDTTPGREYTLGYPFSFPSTYSEKKKDLYNKQ